LKPPVLAVPDPVQQVLGSDRVGAFRRYRGCLSAHPLLDGNVRLFQAAHRSDVLRRLPQFTNHGIAVLGELAQFSACAGKNSDRSRMAELSLALRKELLQFLAFMSDAGCRVVDRVHHEHHAHRRLRRVSVHGLK
jgi:hypothetical protein